ncbi:MAG: hypothetical protein C0597_11180 [Marinilabiliales bacterium]|nr:MAG: hypothetical protein C0597_11180 [Marinilabiliales bacterium]
MKKSIIASLAVFLLAALFIVTSCDEDDDSNPPTIALSEELIDAKAGEEISVDVIVVAEAGLEKVVATTLHDGVAFGTPQEFTTLTFTYTYTVTEDDVDPILSIQFTAIDNDGQEVSKDVVVDVELTVTQLLLKYDWLLSEEIRELTVENDISDVYTDDIYRFYANGTYDKSIGAKVDAFSDLWYNYCYWNFNEADSMLILSRTGAFLEDVRDTIMLTSIDYEELKGDVVYYGLDAFNTGSEAVPYEAVEDYEKIFYATTRSADFDPYQVGDADDAGPAGTCNDVTWEK